MFKGPEVGKSWECLRDWKEGVALGRSMSGQVEESEARQVAGRVGGAESHAKFDGKRAESFTTSPVNP